MLLPYQILTMELGVERSRKVVTSPANASAVSDGIHTLAAWRCSPRVGSAVQTGAEEVEIDNYDPFERPQALCPGLNLHCDPITIALQPDPTFWFVFGLKYAVYFSRNF